MQEKQCALVQFLSKIIFLEKPKKGVGHYSSRKRNHGKSEWCKRLRKTIEVAPNNEEPVQLGSNTSETSFLRGRGEDFVNCGALRCPSINVLRRHGLRSFQFLAPPQQLSVCGRCSLQLDSPLILLTSVALSIQPDSVAVLPPKMQVSRRLYVEA